MPPRLGSIHRRPRRDSGAARLWGWARGRRAPWTVADAAAAAGTTPRRAREIVAALAAAGALDEVAPSDWTAGQAALYRVSAAGRGLAGPPVLVVDAERGRVVGVRLAPAAGPLRNRELAALVAASGLSTRAAARRLGVADTTLRRMLAGEVKVYDADPVLAGARALGAG